MRTTTSQAPRDRRKGRRRAVSIAAGAVLLEVAGMRVRGYRFGGNVVVRCRQGHLLSTIWIPGASLKALKLGWWRFQYCPVGRHWSLVTPVKESELSDEQLRSAREHHDIPLP